jgi:hypothetical protein
VAVIGWASTNFKNMTPKEKALELFEKYNKSEILFYQVDKMGAIEASLIAVDEILHFMDLFNLDLEMKIQHEWWMAVKAELRSI